MVGAEAMHTVLDRLVEAATTAVRRVVVDVDWRSRVWIRQ